MAKGKYKKWLEPESLILIEGWARDGFTDEQIAQKMEIGYSTLQTWKSKYQDIQDSLKKGKEVVDYQVENALLSSALEGNTTAQIIWLKNRRPDKWRDKVDNKSVEERKDNNLITAIIESSREDISTDDLREIQQTSESNADVVEQT